ncbi:response regulator transcription factor [Shimia biformata]|uniref:response regulator transcription factor n=1 Tax=Shimia biformata TaxID=1294299 RepID=UPI00194DEFA5|nr:response regulator transcription factor [Shimia biformata]
MKILAVDDDPLIIHMLDGTLSSLGYTDVDFALGAEEALEMMSAATTPYECFLLDIQMPQVTGIELCRTIRSSRQYSNTPIMMLTAMKEKVYIDEAFAAGATDYLTKPFDVCELGARLRVAFTLRTEALRRQESERTAHSLMVQVEENRRFDLDEAVTIAGIPRVLNALALENYMLQLSRGTRFRFAAIGVAIENVSALYAHNSPTEFYDLLTEVADALFEATRGTETMISYLGSGIFVLVVPRVNNLDSEAIRDQVNADLQEVLEFDDQSAGGITIRTGEQVNSSFFGSDPVRLVQRATEALVAPSAQMRSKSWIDLRAG